MTIKTQPLTATALTHNKTIIAILKGMRQAAKQGHPVYLENRKGERYLRIKWVPGIPPALHGGCRKGYRIAGHPGFFEFFTRLQADVSHVVSEAAEWFWPAAAYKLFLKITEEANKPEQAPTTKADRKVMHQTNAVDAARGKSLQALHVVKYQGRVWYVGRKWQTWWERVTNAAGRLVILGCPGETFNEPVGPLSGFVEFARVKAIAEFNGTGRWEWSEGSTQWKL